MNHLIDKLKDVDGMLGDADHRICNGMSLAAATGLDEEHKQAIQTYRDARQTLQLTTKRLREEWAEVVQTGEGTIAMLEKLRDHDLLELDVGILTRQDVTRTITEIIGQLDGSLPMEEGEDEAK